MNRPLLVETKDHAFPNDFKRYESVHIMRTPTLCILLHGFVLAVQPLISSAGDLKEWPLRNGDFSTFWVTGTPDERFLETGDAVTYEKYLARCRPADWLPETISGAHRFGKAEAERPQPDLPYHVFALLNRPSAAVIETREPGRAAYVQHVDLMRGNYRLSVEATGTTGAKAQIGFVTPNGDGSCEPIPVDPSWTSMHLDVTAPGGTVEIKIYADASAGHTVRFRNAQLDIQSLASSTVPFEDGQPLAGIILPEEPTLAEGFAGYELQRYIFHMTGTVPGMQGRDATFEGRWIRLGRAAGTAIR
jgi:hypothetical protein